MSKDTSIFNGIDHLYAENLKGKRVTLTIKKVVPAEFPGPQGVKEGFDVHFVETPKLLGISNVTNRRGLWAATGTEDYTEMESKKIILYAAKESRSPTGEAIRIARAE